MTCPAPFAAPGFIPSDPSLSKIFRYSSGLRPSSLGAVKRDFALLHRDAKRDLGCALLLHAPTCVLIRSANL
jgi:hypothetical protein